MNGRSVAEQMDSRLARRRQRVQQQADEAQAQIDSLIDAGYERIGGGRSGGPRGLVGRYPPRTHTREGEQR